MRRLMEWGWGVCLAVTGWTLLLLGVAMLVLPGPGILGVFLGLVVLAQRYPWARRLQEASREKVRESVRVSVESRWRIAVSVLAVAALVTCGLFVASDPRLPGAVDFEVLGLAVGPRIPGAGLLPGSVMVASALLALAIVVGAWWRFRHENRELQLRKKRQRGRTGRARKR